jgi:hypothetical protein
VNSFGVEIKPNLANDAMILVVKDESEALKKLKYRFGWEQKVGNEKQNKTENKEKGMGEEMQRNSDNNSTNNNEC